MNKLIYFVLFIIANAIIISSCTSTKGSFYRKESPFVHLDSSQASQREINFSFSKKEEGKWITYDKREIKKGKLSYFIKVKDSSYGRNYSTAAIIAFSNKVKQKWKKEVSVKDVLDDFIWNKQRWRHKKNKYILSSFSHKKYGKIYI